MPFLVWSCVFVFFPFSSIECTFFLSTRKCSDFKILRYKNSITSIRARIRNAPSTYLRGHFSSSSANVVAVFVLEKTIYY